MLAAAHMISTLVMTRMTTVGRPRSPGQTESMWLGLSRYFREMRQNRSLATLFSLNIAVEIFGFSYLTVIPELAVTRLGLGEEGVGVLHAVRAVGGLIGGLILTRSARIVREGRAYLLILMSFGLVMIALAISGHPATAVTAIALVAACASGEFTVWAASQSPHELRAFTARLLGLSSSGRAPRSTSQASGARSAL